MPFFFIAPIWIVCILVGGALLLSARWRFLSTYLFLSSTLGLIFSFLLSTSILLLSARFVEGTPVAWVALLAYIFGIFLVATVGILTGLFAARALNRRLLPNAK